MASASQASSQIRQMSNFILQEAHEKANELRVRTEHDFNLQKQTLIHAAKLDVVAEFERKGKEEEVKARIAKSAAVGDARTAKMKYRDDLLKGLLSSARQRASLVSKDQNYSSLLKSLLVQSLIKIEETNVTVYARSDDVALVQAQVPVAVAEYAALMKSKASVAVRPSVTVSTDASSHLPPSSLGGVVVTADDGRVVCDNTLEARLSLVYEELMPSIRACLFPEGQ
eukprot:CAMPEP_0182458620 /NCGR_PEP_ID=MMETSP1319-20130603/3925_1 /TAXON_ID=172717 /ORGANISM="Bolidomonas pacifica, Strain RCC208" /LENGTH=226 /DNA_ID=CAMNT_0024657343 /DNA_START=156 /DNA_END=836 /DNA_ORIENTATION=-